MKPCSFVASISILSLLVTTAHALRQAKPLSFFARRSCCEKLFNSWTACCSCSGNTFRGEVDSGDCPALHGLVQSVRSRKGHGVLTEAHTHTRTHTHTHTLVRPCLAFCEAAVAELAEVAGAAAGPGPGCAVVACGLAGVAGAAAGPGPGCAVVACGLAGVAGAAAGPGTGCAVVACGLAEVAGAAAGPGAGCAVVAWDCDVLTFLKASDLAKNPSSTRFQQKTPRSSTPTVLPDTASSTSRPPATLISWALPQTLNPKP